ncbi:DUF99 family protein [Candidatus Marithioploca araucensis]|uniref:DUF99 family protein n=1 Tax=Candidatus Marithioploca araucensis TaxID=70273 RepID=A0ABT7VRB3_9GAMM|nr:DUF99 family protein [Candidatus Marithioploca araucensis]
MKNLEQLLQKKRVIRVIGFDDAPFENQQGASVNVAGVVCAGTRFEGMVWGTVQKDGDDATAVLSELLLNSKFYDQVHLVLIDGLAVGGFNLIDLPFLARRLERPCVSVMRKLPNMIAIEKALKNLPQTAKRLSLIQKAGKIQVQEPFYFQAPGENPETVGKILHQLTYTGHVPEALRLAHLIGKAVMTGESGKRA